MIISEDTRVVLDHLLSTNIWSMPGSLTAIKHLIIDVESVLTCLFRLCVRSHDRRQKGILSSNRTPYCHTVTLINYIEFSQHVNQFLDFLADANIEPILVYEGGQLEAPVHGLLAAQFKRESIDLGLQLRWLTRNETRIEQLEPTGLSLNIFKSIINARPDVRPKIRTFQAFYSSYPLMTKLARDFRCPVLTNRGDFILMDVRAGFILFDELWRDHIELHNLATRNSVSSIESQLGKTKPANMKSAIKPSKITGNMRIRLHLNHLFLKQHPGLNANLAMNIFPLTNKDFIIQYSSSLKHLKVYNRDYKDPDFPPRLKHPSKILHGSSERIEQAISFLAGKDHDIVGNYVRGEAVRNKSSFDADYRALYNRYAVAHEFKFRLRKVLAHLDDPRQLNYIERCFTERDCTIKYLMCILSCSIAQLASVHYGSPLHFEDISTKHSASSLQDRSRITMMNLLCHPNQRAHEASNSGKIKHGPGATLTVLHRQEAALVEQTLTSDLDEKLFGTLGQKLNLKIIAEHKHDPHDCASLINLAFKCRDMTKLPSIVSAKLSRIIVKDENHLSTELALILSIFNFAHRSAQTGDSYYDSNYSELKKHFEIAIFNQHLYSNRERIKADTKALAALFDLVKKRDLVNVALPASLLRPRKKDDRKQASHDTLTDQSDLAKQTSKHIRHLIELLGSSLEVYYEMNGFLNYPMPKLNLSAHYNPILLYNLALYSCLTPKSKELIQF